MVNKTEVEINYKRRSQYSHQKIIAGTGGFEKRGPLETTQFARLLRLLRIQRNLRGLAVSQTPVENHQRALV